MTISSVKIMPKKILLLKAVGQFKNSGNYYLLNGRWHKLHRKQKAPKGAPVVSQKGAAGQFVPKQHFTDSEWSQLKLPDTNSNAKTFNGQLGKLRSYSDAGDVTAILGSQYGSNTYGKKLATIANKLLDMYGSEHKVTAGQKAGQHPVAGGDIPAADPIAKPEQASPIETAPIDPVDPEPDASASVFVEGKNTTKVVSHYETQAQKISDLVAAGDAPGLQALKDKGLEPNSKGKIGNTWSGKTANSKTLLAMHSSALKKLGAAPDQIVPKRVLLSPKKQSTPEPISGTSPDFDTALLPDSNTNAKSHNGKVAQIKAMFDAGDIAGLESYKAGKNTYGQKQMKLAASAASALSSAQPEAVAPDPDPTPEQKPAEPDFKQHSQHALPPIDDVISKMPQGLTASTGGGVAHIILDSYKDGDLKALQNMKGSLFSPTMTGALLYQGKQKKAMLAFINAAIADLESKPVNDDEGPKDGDTKQGADGMLVFKNGRWHKEVVAEVAADDPMPEPDSGIQIPVFDGPNAKHNKIFTAASIELKNAVDEQGKNGLKGKLINHKNGQYSVKLKTSSISKFSEASSNAEFAKLAKFITELKGVAGSAPKPKPAPKVAPTSVTSAIEPMDDWVQTGAQGGSNPGGKFKDASGVEWYCKFPENEDHAKAEILAASLYAAAGLSSQDAKLVTQGGKIGIASKWIDVSKGSPSQLAGLDGAQAGFAVDAWLGNWDVVGMGYDNLQIGPDGKAHRIDAGGSLMYRAQGGKKVFGDSVIEIDSLRDKSINAQAAAVFGSMTKADITASVAKLDKITDDQIIDIVMAHGPGDNEAKGKLAETLIARKQDLLEKYPVKKKVKPKPDPMKLKVDPSQLAQIHDFANWNGPGNGLSSKSHINEANQKAEQEILEVAMQGNLPALQDYHFDAVDKDTGAPLGSKHIKEHPSQHVTGYWSDLVSTLSYIAFPPEALKRFKTLAATSISKVSDAFKSAPYGNTTEKAAANSKLAFWIALGKVKPASNLLSSGGSFGFESSPAGVPTMTTSMRAQAKEAYSALGSSRLVRRFINGIQSSGTYNDNFRDGLLKTGDGYNAVNMVKDAYDFAAEKPEGFEIYKWISFPKDMAKQLEAAPEGTVFQNPGSMCCSTHPTGTSGFGPDRMRIRYAKGAKGVDSFGSGKYKSENEITTLPGQRFVILSSKKVQCPVKGQQRMELDVLMLPPDPSYLAELDTMKGGLA